MLNMRTSQTNSVLFLLGFNILIYLGVLLFQNPSLTIADTIEVFGAFNGYFVQQGFLWLFITAAFLHFDIIHIAFNMFALVQLGFITRTYYGDKVIFLTYILTAIASHIATYIATLIGIFSPVTISIGSSGAIFGILGLLIGGTLKKRRYGAELPITAQQFTPILINALVISFIPGVNWVAHLGGFVAGIGLGQFIPPVANSYEQKQVNLVQLLWLITVLLFVLSYVALLIHLFLGN